jgi:RHS repeat-associated protein
MAKRNAFSNGFVRVGALLFTSSVLAGPPLGAEEKASHQVSPFAGSLSYTIPIQVPPFHGIEPRLALTYSSEGRNGFVGVGWTLSGFSTIERVNSGRGAAFFDASDVYLLDGQKLLPCPTPNTSASCASGGTHSTEIESYLKIVRAGDIWTVYGKDGTRTVFSPIYTVPSSYYLTGGILRWGQTSVTDTHNNVVTYVWTDQEQVPPGSILGDVYPSLVQYNGYEVRLFRENRPDVVRFGASTALGETRHRLRSVFVSLSGGAQIRAYKLDYGDPSVLTGRSLLRSEQQYGNDVNFNSETGVILSGTSLPARTFTYQDDALGKTFQTVASTTPWCPDVNYHRTGDFNGDGRTDRLCLMWPSNVEVMLATGTGFAPAQVWLSQGLDASTTLGDFNGDGKTDLAVRADYTAYVFLSTGTAFTYNPNPWGIYALRNPPETGAWRYCGDTGSLVPGDFNGDGVTDLGCRNYATGDIFVGISTTAQFLVSFWAINVFCQPNGETYGASDFDGNGMDDFYCTDHVSPVLFVVWPSTGRSFYTQAPSFGALGGDFCPNMEYVFGDVNADGRADVVCSPNSRVALSTGRHFEIHEPPGGPFSGLCSGTNTNAVGADVDGDGATEVVCNNTGAGPGDIQVRKWTGSGLGTSETWMDNWCPGVAGGGLSAGGDFNGDGKTDLYCHTATAPVAVAGTGGWQADLVSSIANGLGGTIQVAYTPSAAFPNTNNPPPKHVVTTLTRLDGRGGSSTSTFIYADGLMNRKERRFLGFRIMRETLPCIGNEAGTTGCPWVNTILSQELASAGRPTTIARRVGTTRRLSRTEYQYAVNSASQPMTALLTGETVIFFDQTGTGCSPSPCPTVRRRYAEHFYDEYGNRIRTESHGDLDVSNDQMTTSWSYRPNPGPYIVGKVATETQFEGIGTAGAQLAARRFVYDYQESALMPPIRGDVTKAERWLEEEDRWVPRTFGYDDHGNQTSVVDETGRPTTMTYDEIYRVYPESVTRGTGAEAEVSTTVWDPVCSAPFEVNGPNQLFVTRSTTQYDALCRPLRTDTPLGGFKEWAYEAFGNPDFSYPGAQRVIEYSTSPSADWDSGSPHYVTTYIDGFGRTYRTVAKGPAPELDIIQDTSFNARGGVTATTAPYYATMSPQTTLYRYDPADRILAVTFPDLEEVTKSYDLLSETTNDEHGHPVVARFDVFGREVSREQVFEGEVVRTSSDYDVLGRLVGLTDGANNAWSWTYDSLGRNTVKADPDAGTWTYGYDDADRPRLQVDAKQQHTDFEYDTAGRLKIKRTRETATSPAATTTFVKGEYRNYYFNAGQVTSIISVSPSNTPIDSLQMNYDTLGQLVNQRRDFDGLTFVSDWRYDAGGRLRGVTFPDGYVVGSAQNPLRYDAAGRLILAPGIVDHVLYDASGRPIRRTNANNTETTWTYSAQRGFLTGITTSKVGAPAGGIQNLVYVPDETGMVKQVISCPTCSNESWSYTYDELHRLTLASSANPANTQQFDYDGIGRMTFNSRVGSYSYPLPGAPRPHAPTATGSTTNYNYDDNGNMTAGGSRTLQWNVDNLPTQINGVQFVYGATGERIKKWSAAGTSRYPMGDDYEVTNGVVTKYVSLPGLGLVAKRESTTTYWLHTERLASLHAITDLSGTVVHRGTYRPYGERMADTTPPPPTNPPSSPGPHVESRGYIGQRQDPESGLTYLHARYYDPALAVFISPDPLGPEGGLNQYAYALGDPVNLNDPYGLIPVDPNEPRAPNIPWWLPRLLSWLFGGRDRPERHQPPRGDIQDCAVVGTCPGPGAPSPAPAPSPPGPGPGPGPGPTPGPEPKPCERAGTCDAGKGSILDNPTLNMLTQQETGQSFREFLADAPVEIALSAVPPGRFAKFIPLRLRTTHLYSLWSANADGSRGEFLKWGISWSPWTRYRKPFLRGKILQIEAKGSRAEMRALERSLTERAPGALNHEPWAGVVLEQLEP